MGICCITNVLPKAVRDVDEKGSKTARDNRIRNEYSIAGVNTHAPRTIDHAYYASNAPTQQSPEGYSTVILGLSNPAFRDVQRARALKPRRRLPRSS